MVRGTLLLVAAALVSNGPTDVAHDGAAEGQLDVPAGDNLLAIGGDDVPDGRP